MCLEVKLKFLNGDSLHVSFKKPHLVSGSSSNADEVVANNRSYETDEIVKGSIYLPNSLLKSVGNQLSRCQFVMYEETTFFDVSIENTSQST